MIERSLDRWVRKPYYVFRPSQLVRRVSRSLRVPPECADIRLPWGVWIECSPREEIGRALWTTGVYEPAITEVLWRLLDPGDVAVDGGANIGYMTSVLAARVGTAGKVYAFEPHPDIRARLRRNVRKWSDALGWVQIDARPQALSRMAGSGSLYADAGFDANQGTASVTSRTQDDRRFEIECTTLDAALADVPSIGLLKLDIEGHEYDALLGASRLLDRRTIRDVVFESFDEADRCFEFLEGRGYTVFRIWRGLLRPLLRPARFAATGPLREPPSFLATRDVDRALARLKNVGWRTLGNVHNA